MSTAASRRAEMPQIIELAVSRLFVPVILDHQAKPNTTGVARLSSMLVFVSYALLTGRSH